MWSRTWLWPVCFVTGLVTVSTALQWTPGTIADNMVVTSCPGENVTLPWSYTLDPGDHLYDITWQYVQDGKSPVAIASYIDGNFLVARGVQQDVSFLPNAGLMLSNVSLQDIGVYRVEVIFNRHGSLLTRTRSAVLHVPAPPTLTTGALYVTLLPGVEFNQSTQHWHGKLACGEFASLGQPPVSLVWTTPDGRTESSSSHSNSSFFFTLPHPLVSGNYSCHIPSSLPEARCLESDSPLLRGATIHVDEDDVDKDLRGEAVSSCQEVKMYDRVSGLHSLHLHGNHSVLVYCDQDTADGGWAVVQRRLDGSVDFYRNWTEYENGFGDPQGEVWLGLSNIHLLTTTRNTSLRIELEDFDGTTAYALYDHFYITGPDDNYTLHVSGYSGTAGDGLAYHHESDSQPFSTPDRDNDHLAFNYQWHTGSCAQAYHGGWWYSTCAVSNLNGRYKADGSQGHDGITWREWKHDDRSYKATEMKIRPTD